jgi:subtilisin family serine protease
MYRQVDVDISNNSWGFSWFFHDNFNDPEFAPFEDALEHVVENGRDGLGAARVFSAGNSRSFGDSSDCHNLTSSRYTISVGAMGDNGTSRNFSNAGSGGFNTVTTDRTGSDGYSSDFELGDYTDEFGGTSAAAPILSGVAALMLEANADLGYRDVQKILAYSATHDQVGLSYDYRAVRDYRWAVNEEGNWHSGGLGHDRVIGFGTLDAQVAVRMAESW